MSATTCVLLLLALYGSMAIVCGRLMWQLTLADQRADRAEARNARLAGELGEVRAELVEAWTAAGDSSAREAEAWAGAKDAWSRLAAADPCRGTRGECARARSRR